MKSIAQDEAVVVLCHAIQMSPGLDAIVDNCIEMLAKGFENIPTEAFMQFPEKELGLLLGHPLLKASPCSRCRCVTAYLRQAEREGPAPSKAAFDRFSKYIDQIHLDDAFFLLKLAQSFDQTWCYKACILCIANNFTVARREDLVTMNFIALRDLLDKDDLNCSSEDQVFFAIQQWCDGQQDKLIEKQSEELWATCRLPFLSHSVVIKLATVEHISAEWVKLGLVGWVINEKDGTRALEDFACKHDSEDGSGAMARRLWARIPNIGEIRSM